MVKRQGASGQRGSAQHFRLRPAPWTFAQRFISIKDCIFDSENGREVVTVMATPAGRDRCTAKPVGRHQRCRASIVTINQATPENGSTVVAVTIRTDTMQMTPKELTEKLSRQRMVVGVHCGYNL